MKHAISEFDLAISITAKIAQVLICLKIIIVAVWRFVLTDDLFHFFGGLYQIYCAVLVTVVLLVNCLALSNFLAFNQHWVDYVRVTIDMAQFVLLLIVYKGYILLLD